MTKEDIALQLTLKALEQSMINQTTHKNKEDNDSSLINAKRIYDFYNAIYSNLIIQK